MNGNDRQWGARGVAAALVVVASGALVAATMAYAKTTSAEEHVFGAPAGSFDGGVPAYIVNASQGIVRPPDLRDVEDLCALLTSCDKLPFPPNVIPNSMPKCVEALMATLSEPDAVKFSLAIREAGLAAISCKDLRDRALHGADPNACKGRGRGGRGIGICDLDGRAITCYNEQVVAVRDCPRGGEQCVAGQGQAACAIGPCTEENKEGGPWTCSASGQRMLRCDHGKLASLDCAAFGLKCTTDQAKAGCAPPTPTCAGPGIHCDGNVAVGCEHGHEVRIDCGAAGMTCSQTAGSTAVGACVAPPPSVGEKCDAKDASKCDGAKISYCFAGQRRSYLCKTVGLDKCVKEGGVVHCG